MQVHLSAEAVQARELAAAQVHPSTEVLQWEDAQVVDADKRFSLSLCIREDALSIRNKRVYFILHSIFSLFLLYIGKLIFIGLGLLFVRKAVLFVDRSHTIWFFSLFIRIFAFEIPI